MKHLEENVKLLNHIHENPESTQRILVKELDFSLGKINYLIKALTEKGIIKLKSFKSSHKKAGYLYYLTPKGIKKKTEITRRFLEQRLEEYDNLQEEIKTLKMRLETTGESQD
jgi:EPS-associated MarR family transcriptional regulator